MLPTVNWDVDPVFLNLPREGVVIALGLLAAFSLGMGFYKKANDQLVSGLFFGLLAYIVHTYMDANYGIRYYSLLFVLVFLGGHALLKWQITRARGSAEDANDFIVYGVLGVLVGARVGHVLFYDLDKALEDPFWVFKIWTGGLASHGAVIGLILAMFLYTKRRGIPFLEGSDRFSYSATLGATLVRVGNLLNSEIVGKVTDGTWGFRFPRYDHTNPPLRHPSQLYEIALGCFVMGALYVIDKKLGEEKRPRGAMISSFFLLYFSGRFIVEFYKEFQPGEATDSMLRMGQILSIPGILLGVIGLIWSFKKRLPAQWPQAETFDDEDDEEELEDEEDEEELEDEEEAAETEQAKPAAKAGRPAAAAEEAKDNDVDSEFDAEGRLKKVRESE